MCVCACMRGCVHVCVRAWMCVCDLKHAWLNNCNRNENTACNNLLYFTTKHCTICMCNFIHMYHASMLPLIILIGSKYHILDIASTI